MKYLSLIIVLAFAISCTKLDPKIYSDLTTANAYLDESDVNAALIGIYADVAPSRTLGYNAYYNGYMVMTTDYTTDMGFSLGGGDVGNLSNWTYNANDGYIERNWKYMYGIIANVNMLLSKIGGVSMDETKKNVIIAQARFLRALAYRDLTDAWGPVPLITEVIAPSKTPDMALAPVSDVDKQIIEDCKFGIDVLPEKWNPGEEGTRATKGAVAILLGQTYMRAHDYTNARTYIDMVLALRAKGVYRLNPDFKNVWSDNNKADRELIFYVMHDVGLNFGLSANHFGPSDVRNGPHRWSYYAVSLQFWRKYSDLDPRKKFFYYNYEGESVRDTTTTHGYYYMIPDPGQTTPPNDTTILLQHLSTMKYTYEMTSNTYYDGRTNSVFRLSDAILCKAEIENELVGPSAALPYVNEVRGRAGAPKYGDPGFPVPASKEQMAQKILDERGFELVFEFKRRPDLIRFGKYESTCNDYLISRGLPPIVKPSMLYLVYPLVDAQSNRFMASENLKRMP